MQESGYSISCSPRQPGLALRICVKQDQKRTVYSAHPVDRARPQLKFHGDSPEARLFLEQYSRPGRMGVPIEVMDFIDYAVQFVERNGFFLLLFFCVFQYFVKIKGNGDRFPATVLSHRQHYPLGYLI